MEHDDGVWLIAVFEQKSVYKVTVVCISDMMWTFWLATSLRRRHGDTWYSELHIITLTFHHSSVVSTQVHIYC